MLSWTLFSNPISIFVPPTYTLRPVTVRVWFKHQPLVPHSSTSAVQSVANQNKGNSSVHRDSLRVLEWDKLCDCVSSFARTALGREATKAGTYYALYPFCAHGFCLLKFRSWFGGVCCCNRHSCGLWIRRMRKVWDFWMKPMPPLRCTSMVVVPWISAAPMSLWLILKPNSLFGQTFLKIKVKVVVWY